MEIKMKRIRSVKKYLADIDENGTFYIGVQVDSKVKNILTQFFDVMDSKKTLFMPQPYIGIMSKRNTVGEFIADKTKPKETQYRAQNWSLKDWGGTWHSGTSEVPYPGYPKNFTPPKNYYFHYLKDSQHNNNQLLVIDKTFTNVDAEFDNIRFCINLVLEIFSEAETFIIKGKKLEPIIKKVPWEVLPKGEQIWKAFKDGKSYPNISKSERYLIKERFDYIESFKPDNEYQGTAGYTGYVVFSFENKQLYILDSVIYGNATYIFSDSWENVSKLSKKEIIQGNLEKKRIIHSPNWKRELKKELTE
ncbi:hypothetical protein JMK96_11060 [Lactobacillus sp. GPR40-2]|nr:hypothetical protein [Lactobacillus sp. GPR40-2]MBL3631153.1 hypothetical protein [Lactobacillus sp. GPB7-4]